MENQNFLEAFKSASKAGKVRHLVGLARQIDQHWPSPKLIDRLETALRWLSNDNDSQLRSLATLADKISPQMNRRHFLGLAVPLERAEGRNICDAQLEQLWTQDSAAAKSPSIPVQIGCENIRSAFNLGSFFRTADCFRLAKLHLIGYSATPDNPKLQRAALGCETSVPWRHWQSSAEMIAYLRSEDQNLQVIGVETARSATELQDVDLIGPSLWMFGNEVHGLEPTTLALCDELVRIPMYGHKNSLNVASAFSIVAYNARQRWSPS